YNGPDSFTYTVSDGTVTVEQTVTVAVTPVNDPPAAANDALTTDEDTAFIGNLFVDNGSGADGDIEGDTLTVTRVTAGANVGDLAALADGTGVATVVAGGNGGTFIVASNGVVSFDPGTDFEDLDTGESRTTSIVYQIDDGHGGTATAVAIMTVTGVTEDVVPTTATLKPDFENSKHWDTTKNVFIEGDNLEVLKILQKHYHAKIKLIYIDPPYNTGKDFVYPDNYKEGLEHSSEVLTSGHRWCSLGYGTRVFCGPP
ncbi:MAG: hypothetical protein KC435_14655, partial [Thermomicrobiales bacterium]|nr:hypothetical protein [Thermomicrobiales bacterium]